MIGLPGFTVLQKRLADDTVRQDRHGESLDVIRDDVVSPLDECECLCRAIEKESAARACSAFMWSTIPTSNLTFSSRRSIGSSSTLRVAGFTMASPLSSAVLAHQRL